jgi:hypothetical protein
MYTILVSLSPLTDFDYTWYVEFLFSITVCKCNVLCHHVKVLFISEVTIQPFFF